MPLLSFFIFSHIQFFCILQWMEPIQKKYADAGLSYADLYTLGGGMFVYIG